MIGHELRCSETNSGRWGGVCECGWVSVPVGETRRRQPPSRAKEERDFLLAARVGVQHAEHLELVSADIEARSATVLDRNAKALDRLIPTMLRPGRFGNA